MRRMAAVLLLGCLGFSSTPTPDPGTNIPGAGVVLTTLKVK